MAERTRPLCLVTGANGFLGGAIVQALRASRLPCRQAGLVRESGPVPPDLVVADVRDADSLGRAFEGIDAVVHAAGLAHQFGSRAKSADFVGVNVRGTENVVTAAARAGVRHVVLVSSVSVYGPGGKEARDETAPCRPGGAYASSKLEAELVARRIADKAGLRLTILRMATIYGEGDPGNVGRLVRAIDRKRFLWIGDGSNRKSLLHRDDAARACVAALRSQPVGETVFNVSAPAVTMREVVAAVSAALGRAVPRPGVPAGAAWALAAVSASVRKWLSDDVYDASRFERAFQFRAEIGLEEGIVKEVSAYRAARNSVAR